MIKMKPIFLYQGGLNNGRGIEILLETFKNIENKNLVIVFMGYGTLEDEIKKIQRSILIFIFIKLYLLKYY